MRPDNSGLAAGSPSGKDAHATREAVGQPSGAAEHLKQALSTSEVDWLAFDAGQVLRRCFRKRRTSAVIHRKCKVQRLIGIARLHKGTHAGHLG